MAEEELKYYKEKCERDEKQINYLQTEIIRLTETINDLKLQLQFNIEKTKNEYKKNSVEIPKKNTENNSIKSNGGNNTTEEEFSDINMKITQLRSLIENLPTAKKTTSSGKNPLFRIRGGNESSSKDDFKNMLTSVGTVFGEDSSNLLANKEQVLQKWELNFEDLEFGDEKGTGAFSTVYDGYYKTLYVAIKKLRFESLPNYEEYLTTFEKEVALISTFDHINVCKFVGVVTFPSYYMVSEFMENGSLDDLLHDKNKVVTWQQKINFLKDIAKGLIYLHGLNPRIIHRDLKCGNVLVDKKMVGKLTDFGLSIPKSDRVSPNELQLKWGITPDKNQPSYIPPVKTPVGTYPFIAPEIIESKPYNELVDVYSYSLCIFHVITRTPPWNGKTDSIWERLEKDALDNKKSVFKPDLPKYFSPKVRDLVVACWDNDPTLRPSLTNVLKILDEIEKEPECKN